ncbi:amino acid adenylation domain-containing protein [Streptomyces sp. NPDC021020]|uniref:amino acid adenylation domain-containing protein n=1 Tax=Streptomyces sp. NPDC021020 TaxID=3365109 RepID=UPI0037933474
MDSAVGRSLVQRWRAKGVEAASPADAPAALSTVQRGVLTFERLHPGTAVFNLPFMVRHRGPLDEDRLDAALAAVVRRHPALRSTFADDERGMARTVQDSAAVTTRWTDFRHLPPPDREIAARDHAERVAAEPFDLGHAPLARLAGCRLADDERLLVFVAHHLVCDGGSMQVLLADLSAAYEGGLGGPVPGAAPAPAGPAAAEFWRTRLAGLPVLDLPTDRPRPPRPTFRAGSVPVDLPAELVRAAERLGREENATVFMVVLAAFQLLLGEQSGQTDFAVGVPEAGRSGPGRHGVVGLLSDMLLLRADLSGRRTFRDLVRGARAASLAALGHRGVPFEELAAMLGPGRGRDTGAVRAGLAFHGDWGRATLAGSPLHRLALTRPGIRYDVDLHLWRERGGLHGTWDYSAEVFDASTASRTAGRLPVLLARVLAEPDRPTDGLDLLTDDDRAALDRWARGPVPDDPDTTLTELFAAQAARTPDAVAVEDAHRGLTYRRLDERSNQLAHHLRGRSVGADDVVGIRLGRSADLAVAMLGVLKTGAAYLPLDPAYPADRIAYMLDDSSARTVVTAADLRASEGEPTSAAGTAAPAPDQVAYLLYTSGSTGRPKGVLTTHRNAAALVRWASRAFPPADLARTLASTSICFDVSVFEFFGPLCSGGTVVVVENALALLVDRPEVTMVSSVPSAARALVAAGAVPPSVRAVGLAGEAVTQALVDDLYATGHIEAVFNLYGPTEDTTYSTAARLLPGEPPPIGAPLPHGRAYVLDRALRPVPVGAVGELYLAGRGLSRGYLNQPALTASRYLADPFAGTTGERMYRTGDLVRRRADGALLYLGRSDFQIKIRGQRIELGEIESTMQRHPDVRDAVVALHGDRLVGYVTAAGPGGLDVDDVRARLRRTLPVVMVPATLVLLEAMPQTPNGKVDRLSLPVPALPADTGAAPAVGAAEQLVADVWREVLGRESVGRDDDFFDLGGDSLLAGGVISRLRARAGLAIPLRLVFENPRLSDLAAALPEPGPADDVPRLTPRSPDAEPVLSFDQQRIWLECQFRPKAAYNIHGRQWLRGPLDRPVLERSIRAVIGRHESLRTTFHQVGGRPVQRVSDPDPQWRLGVEDLSGQGPGAAVAAERLADGRAATPFDLAAGPLFDCLLIRVSDTEHLLSMTIHHIVADGRSTGLVLRELSALYRAGGDPGPAALPALPLQYRDYAVWQRNTLTGERLAHQVAHWRDRLAGAPPVTVLPAARRRSPSQGAVGGRVGAELGDDGAAALRRLCREHDVTPFMAVLAAVATVLHRWSGQGDLVVGVPVDTRGACGADALVGMFVNTVPLRVGLAGDPTFGDVLDRVRTAALDGYVAHGRTPFEVLVSELRAMRDPSRTPVFQVLVNMVESVEQDWRLPGVSVETCEGPPQPGKFDLDLTVLRRGDGYRFDLLYHADRYETSMMDAFLGQLRAVLAAAAEGPARRIRDLDLAGPASAGPAAPATGIAERFGLTAEDRLAVLAGGSGLRRAARSTAAAVGCKHVVADDEVLDDPVLVLRWLRRTSVTVVHLTAPALRALASRGAASALPTLRCVFLANGGDVTAHDVGLVRWLAPGCRVVGLYQPDPASPPPAAFEVPADWSPDTAPLRLPIGSALREPAVTVNPAGRPSAAGEVAELCFGGVRTGDLVRRRADGLIEFAGPRAGQGMGTEAADRLETVAALLDVDGVHDAEVSESVGQDGRTGLTAYVAAPGRSVDVGRLRQHLVTRLPEYLVPRQVVVLDRLPLTRDGDHDRALLPAAQAGRPRSTWMERA